MVVPPSSKETRNNRRRSDEYIAFAFCWSTAAPPNSEAKFGENRTISVFPSQAFVGLSRRFRDVDLVAGAGQKFSDRVAVVPETKEYSPWLCVLTVRAEALGSARLQGREQRAHRAVYLEFVLLFGKLFGALADGRCRLIFGKLLYRLRAAPFQIFIRAEHILAARTPDSKVAVRYLRFV